MAGRHEAEGYGAEQRAQWYFGMKAHVGVDAASGLVHTSGVTTGKVHDAKVMANLIREDDAAVYGDKGYASDEKKRSAEAAGVLLAVKEKAKAKAVRPSQRAPSVQRLSSPATMFSGDYPSFADAAAECEGYDARAPAQSAASQLRSFLQITTQPVQIDGRFQQVHSAISVAREFLKEGPLSVLDIGGAGGNYFFPVEAPLAVN